MTSRGREVVTQAEAARRIGRSKQAVGGWCARPGAPVEWRKGVAHPIWPDFPRWRDEELDRTARATAAPADFDEAKARKTAAEAILAELEVERTRGNLVTLEAFQQVLGDRLDRLRARLQTLPGRGAPRTVGLRTLAESQAVWESLVTEIMHELAHSRNGDGRR